MWLAPSPNVCCAHDICAANEQNHEEMVLPDVPFRKTQMNSPLVYPMLLGAHQVFYMHLQQQTMSSPFLRRFVPKKAPQLSV